MEDPEKNAQLEAKIEALTSKHDRYKPHTWKPKKPPFLENIDGPTLLIVCIFLVMTGVMIVAATYLVCCFVYTIIHA